MEGFPWLPWMPSTFYHDDHHRYFHVNYGQHLTLWDRLYGTLRRHDRQYGIEVFGGEGAPLADSPPEPRALSTTASAADSSPR